MRYVGGSFFDVVCGQTGVSVVDRGRHTFVCGQTGVSVVDQFFEGMYAVFQLLSLGACVGGESPVRWGKSGLCGRVEITFYSFFDVVPTISENSCPFGDLGAVGL